MSANLQSSPESLNVLEARNIPAPDSAYQRNLVRRLVLSAFFAFFALNFLLTTPYVTPWLRLLLVAQFALSLISSSAGLIFCVANLPLYISVPLHYGVPYFSVAELLVLVFLAGRVLFPNQSSNPPASGSKAVLFATLWIGWMAVSSLSVLFWLAKGSVWACLAGLLETFRIFWRVQDSAFSFLPAVVLAAAGVGLMTVLSRASPRIVNWILSGVVGATALICLVELARGFQIEFRANFLDRNSFATFVGATVFLGFGVSRQLEHLWAKTGAHILALFLASVVFLSLSLSGVVALLIGFAMLGAYRLKSLHRLVEASFYRAHYLKIILGLVFLYFLFPTIAILVPQSDPIYLAERLRGRLVLLNPAQLWIYFRGDRITMWEVASLAMRQEPITGIGPGNLMHQYPWWTEKAVRSPLNPPKTNAHNYLLQVGAETGAVGLSLFVVLLVSLFASAWRIGTSHDTRVRLWGMPLAASLSVFLITSLSGHPMLVPEAALLFWLIGGAIVAFAPPASGGRLYDIFQKLLSGNSRARWSLAGLVLLLITAALISARSRNFNYWSEGLDPMFEEGPNLRYRWTRRAAIEEMPAQGNWVSTAIRAVHPDTSQRPVIVWVQVNDRHEKLALNDQNWHELGFPVTGPRVRFSFVCSRTWNPKIKFGMGDWRDLGIQVQEYRWSRK